MAGMGSPTPSRATLNASYTLYQLRRSDALGAAVYGARSAATEARRGALSFVLTANSAEPYLRTRDASAGEYATLFKLR